MAKLSVLYCQGLRTIHSTRQTTASLLQIKSMTLCTGEEIHKDVGTARDMSMDDRPAEV